MLCIVTTHLNFDTDLNSSTCTCGYCMYTLLQLLYYTIPYLWVLEPVPAVLSYHRSWPVYHPEVKTSGKQYAHLAIV